jgi:undecaprenyl-diphosphatase
MTFDLVVFQFIHGFAGKIRIFDWLAVFIADYLGYFLILGFLILIFREKNWQRRTYYFFFAALSILLSRGFFTEIIRYFFYQPRPFLVLNISPLINHSDVAAFPSGHIAFYFVLALSVWHLNRRLGWWFLGLVLLMGLARIFVGVHWPSDIIGGILVAGLSFLIVKTILPKTKINI